MAEVPDNELEQLRADAEAGRSAASALEQAQTQLTDAQAALAGATDRYAQLLRQANPDIPADAITGSTVEEVAASAERARAIADAAVAARAGATPPAGMPPPVPAGGAATRATPPTEGLSPQQKIAYGLRQRQT